MSAPNMLAAALAYARLGIPVFPVWQALPFEKGGFICACGKLNCTDAAKHPIGTIVPHGLKDASTEERTVRHYWTGFPNANIGGVMGEILAIDIDPRDGGSASALEHKYGQLPPTWRASTGGGGEHIFFASSDASLKNTTKLLAAGVDTRAHGGYVLLAPSLHISGRRYAWQQGCSPNQIELAPLPKMIADALGTQRTGGPAADWGSFATSGIAEGARNTSLTKLAGYLLRRYVDPRLALELMLAWNACRCAPPLDQKDVVTIVNSIAGKELRRRSR